MKYLPRRIRNFSLMLVAAATLVGVVRWQHDTLRSASFSTGYLLLGAVLFLAAYNWRKKLPFLPLGNSSTWLQLHIYVGFLSIVVFLLHVGFRLPNGVLERLLAGLYSIVAASGLYGLYISRTIPKKLANLSEEIIYERIPLFRRQVCARSQQIIVQSAQARSTTIADFYLARLAQFFERPRSWVYRCWPTSQLRRRLIEDIRDLQRYLSEEEKNVAWSLADLVRQRDDLDYHEAQQWKLKIWLFAHIGLTYGLILVGAFHAVLAHAFHGGMR